MHSQRTTPPSSGDREIPRPPAPGDATDDFIRQLRDGDDSDLFTEEDADEVREEKEALETLHQRPGPKPLEPTGAEVAPAIPPVLRRIFGTEGEDELMAVAKIIDSRREKKLTLVFHTPIGDVKCPVIWSSQAPEKLAKTEDLLLIMVRSSESMFVPNPGSGIEISFWEHRNYPRLGVTCLSRPMQLYAGVGIDLLCFLPDNVGVEKTGQLVDGAPSVVSGQASTGIDDAGEPVADGEKSASVQPREIPFDEESAPVAYRPEVEDFDQPRSKD